MYATAESRTWKFMKAVAVKEHVTSLNFVAFILASGLAICMFVFLSSTQGFVLNQILHIDLAVIGNISGNLTLFDECISLIMVSVWGVCSDRWGRRGIYGAGFVLMGVGLALYPFATALSPYLIVYRGIFAIGGAATSSMLTAVLADYSSEKDRGKVSGMVGLMSGVGALLAVFVFLRLPAKYVDQVHGLRFTYSVVAGICAVFGAFLFIALRPKLLTDPVTMTLIPSADNSSAAETNASTAHAAQPVDRSKSVSFWSGLRAGIAAAKHGKVLLGYIGSFLARGNTIIITIYLPLWVYKYFVDNKLCASANADSDTIKTDCRDAYIRASILSGVAQTAAMLAAPLFGYLGDKLYRPLVVLLATVLGLASYLWLFLCTDPLASVMFVVVVLVGVGEMAIVVSSLSVVTSKAIPTHLRGSISGAYSFSGTIGIMVASKLGGYLFDVWQPTAPFFVMAVGNLVAVVVAVVVLYRDFVAVKAKDPNAAQGWGGLHRALMHHQNTLDELRL
ncbi:hypothetical protein DYB32_003226 [Aphanomyces invadans]|uniref:Major facilitator superfamily (MFS) profile domain-containing protein n=1 Tax=Aphanomyces invadans TaxID=157072 RepID=A0A3R6VZV7_9STRA|nr:hypothetical protein DYB32_003226 [Aphanomyces invadans]